MPDVVLVAKRDDVATALSNNAREIRRDATRSGAIEDADGEGRFIGEGAQDRQCDVIRSVIADNQFSRLHALCCKAGELCLQVSRAIECCERD